MNTIDNQKEKVGEHPALAPYLAAAVRYIGRHTGAPMSSPALETGRLYCHGLGPSTSPSAGLSRY